MGGVARPVIAILRELAVDPREVVRDRAEIVVFAHARVPSRDEVIALGRGAAGLVPMPNDLVDAALLEALPALQVVANHAVGVDNVDLAACRARGVVVTNTPGVLTDATADLTMALLLALVRRVREGERVMRAREPWSWQPTMLLGRELRGARLGIFGFGRIGRAVAERAAAFGMSIAYASRGEAPADAVARTGAVRVSKDELVRTSDVVSIHVPLTPETRHAFDGAALARMKPGALLVNTARGPIVDEEALVAALEAGHLGGAALDVYEREPEVHPGLVGRDDVVLLPHLGSATRETRRRMGEIALENAARVVNGEPPLTPV